jgi:ComF family protein
MHPDILSPPPPSTISPSREADAAPVPSFRARLGDAVRALGKRLIETAYPPQCIACDAATADAHALCPACWSGIRFITKPCCARLGTPFAHDFGAEMLSPAAIADPPRFDVARAVALHDGAARDLVSRFKYGERLDLVRLMARMMVASGGEVLATADCLVPVPMHRLRLFRRRYNQAALLANEIGRLSGTRVEVDALQRVKRTPQQVGLNRAERRANLAGAFRISEAARARVAGRHVVLIDDVRTTGSTLNACAHILRKAGATRIDALTFTLVPEGGSGA